MRILEVVLLLFVSIFLGSLFVDIGNPDSHPFEYVAAKPPKGIQSSFFTRETIHFESKGLQIEAFVYFPVSEDERKYPLVIMAPDIGLQKDVVLEKFASVFVSHEMAVLTFDYRYFGGSEGLPRHTISVSRQIEDFHAAIRFVTQNTTAPFLKQIDIDKIALWGTGFSAGHVLSVASDLSRAENKNISAIVIQNPYVDGISTILSSPISISARLILLGVKDLLLSFFGNNHYIPLASSSQLSVLGFSIESELYSALIPPTSNWVNKVPARGALEFLLYRPILKADSVKYPTLVVYSESDTISKSYDVEKVISILPQVTSLKKKGGHINNYVGSDQEHVALEEVSFLEKHLR
eukprot:TRINITY_DN946_c0_g1_i3.p1 TRINITY_DN946_c0_g1~~TRINITY_DN946_c0_g1_i3.p1  ORF type:complete len:351 (-),score=55.59 TRINITY_DN946_c0_g1_i3:720-1772(-)